MHIQKKENRRFPDTTLLRKQQPYCHTESHHFVTRSHDCLKMQGFYSTVQREPVKKARFQSPSKVATVFVQSFMIFHSISLEFFAYHCSHFLQETDKQKAYNTGFCKPFARA